MQTGVAAVDEIAAGETKVRLNCITFRDLDVSSNAQWKRGCPVVNFGGVAEEVRVETTSASPFVWRRILFTTVYAFGEDIKVIKEEGLQKGQVLYMPSAVPGVLATGQQFRRPAVPESEFKDFFTDFFLTRGVTSQSFDTNTSKVNKSKVDVLFDQRFDYNGVGDGRISKKRLYHRVGKEIQYDVAGGGPGSSPWCCGTSPLGNVYCLDIFTNRDRDRSDPPATVSSEATVYWSE